MCSIWEKLTKKINFVAISASLKCDFEYSEYSRVFQSTTSNVYLEMEKEELLHKLYLSIASEVGIHWLEAKQECSWVCGDKENLRLTRMIEEYVKKHKVIPDNLSQLGISCVFVPMNTKNLATDCFYYHDFQKDILDFPRPFCLIHDDRKNCINCLTKRSH